MYIYDKVIYVAVFRPDHILPRHKACASYARFQIILLRVIPTLTLICHSF